MGSKNNNGQHILDVIERTACTAHDRPIGVACWFVPIDAKPERVLTAVCGDRIRAAGYIGKITETSIQSRRKVGA